MGSEAKIPIALIGAGNWGKNHLRTLLSSKDFDLRVIIDASEDARSKARVAAPNARVESSAKAAFESSEITSVAIVTPAPTHAALAAEALRAGKHVFVEKPLCLSLDEAALLKSTAAKSDRVVMVGHLLEYHPAVDKMRALVDSGELGHVRYIYSERVNLGIVRRDENAWWSLAPHDISVVLYLLGKTPISVAAHGASYLNQGVEDVVFANLQFEGGQMAQIHVSWLDPHKSRKFTVVGERRMATFDDMEPAEKVRVYDKSAEVRTDYASYQELIALRQGDILIPLLANTEPLVEEIKHFARAIRTGQPPRSDLADGMRVVQVLEAGGRSLKAGGRPVTVEA